MEKGTHTESLLFRFFLQNLCFPSLIFKRRKGVMQTQHKSSILSAGKMASQIDSNGYANTKHESSILSAAKMTSQIDSTMELFNSIRLDCLKASAEDCLL